MTSLKKESIADNYNLYEIDNWEDETLDLDNKLLRGIYSFGFEKPSSIQKKLCFQ